MENVFTGWLENFCIKPTMIVESIPPERNAPKGTSATICSRTASESVSLKSAISSSGDRSTSLFQSGSQYRSRCMFPSCHTAKCAGGSL